MGKRRRAFADDGQLPLFEPQAPAAHEGALADLDKVVASAVGAILRGDPRSRYEVAGEVSALLADDVTKAMLDAYAAEAKDNHNVSFARFLALVAATQRFDVLAKLLARIGCTVLVGEEVLAAELGHVEAEIGRLQARARQLKKTSPVITRGGVRS